MLHVLSIVGITVILVFFVTIVLLSIWGLSPWGPDRSEPVTVDQRDGHARRN